MFARLMRLSVVFAAIWAGPALGQSCGTTHTVRPGESLSILAARTLGSPEKFRVIHRANKDQLGANPNNLEVGMRIYLPCEGAKAKAPVTSSGWSPLIDVATLSARRGSLLQIVDLRETFALSAGVIPRALSAPYSQWQAKVPLGSAAHSRELERLLGNVGLRINEPVILVAKSGDPIDAGRAAYVYWLLKSAGARRVAILQGGHDAWAAAGQPVSPRARGVFRFRARVTFSDQWLADQGEVTAIATGAERGALLDAVPYEAHEKQMATADVASLHRAMLTQQSGEDGLYTVLEWAKGLPVNWESELVISYCDTAELAALSWFYISEVAGIRNVKFTPSGPDAIAGEGVAANKV